MEKEGGLKMNGWRGTAPLHGEMGVPCAPTLERWRGARWKENTAQDQTHECALSCAGSDLLVQQQRGEGW